MSLQLQFWNFLCSFSIFIFDYPTFFRDEGKKWHTSTINKILRNEKYIGDALLQKTYTTDFLNKTRVKNNGLVPQYYVEDNHEAIIPKEIYLQVQ